MMWNRFLSTRPIAAPTVQRLLMLCLCWLISAAVAAGVFHLKLFYLCFGWPAFYLALPQFVFGAASVFVFAGWCHWLVTGRQRAATAMLLLPVSLVMWMVPFSLAFREVCRVMASGLIPFGRSADEIDGWTELLNWLVPTVWFFVPVVLTTRLLGAAFAAGRDKASRAEVFTRSLGGELAGEKAVHPSDRTDPAISSQTVWLLRTLMTFWMINGVLASVLFLLTMLMARISQEASSFLLFQMGFAGFAGWVFLEWWRWLASGKETPPSKAVLPASLILWAIPLGIGIYVMAQVIHSGLVPYGRDGAAMDGWDELRLSLLPAGWFAVPFVFTMTLWVESSLARKSNLRVDLEKS